MRHLNLIAAFALAACPTIASADLVDITVTFENLAPENSVSFAPLRVGFGNGSFDSFDINQEATAPIISIAEGGSGSEWFPAFAAAEPNAVTGTVVGGGPFLPGGSASRTFRIDTSQNLFFTFASMVVPSNDLFIGNDDPQAYELFDANGNLLIDEIRQTSDAIWDAGSEVADASNAAFLVGSNNDDRIPENDVVTFDFSELSTYDGLETVAGYTFDADLITAGTDIGRITFSATAVPEPSSFAVLGLASLASLGFYYRRRRRK